LPCPQSAWIHERPKTGPSPRAQAYPFAMAWPSAQPQWIWWVARGSEYMTIFHSMDRIHRSQLSSLKRVRERHLAYPARLPVEPNGRKIGVPRCIRRYPPVQ
jgi:hypothetical protein